MEAMTVLDEAARIVHGSRQHDYGHPADNHACTALMWTAYLQRRYQITVDLDAHDVCLLNILQKTSRDAYHRKRDTLVDIAGYAANADMTHHREDT